MKVAPLAMVSSTQGIGRSSRRGDKEVVVLDILRCFYVGPTKEGRTKKNNSRTQADTGKIEFGLFNWGNAIQHGTERYFLLTLTTRISEPRTTWKTMMSGHISCGGMPHMLSDASRPGGPRNVWHLREEAL